MSTRNAAPCSPCAFPRHAHGRTSSLFLGSGRSTMLSACLGRPDMMLRVGLDQPVDKIEDEQEKALYQRNNAMAEREKGRMSRLDELGVLGEQLIPQVGSRGAARMQDVRPLSLTKQDVCAFARLSPEPPSLNPGEAGFRFYGLGLGRGFRAYVLRLGFTLFRQRLGIGSRDIPGSCRGTDEQRGTITDGAPRLPSGSRPFRSAQARREGPQEHRGHHRRGRSGIAGR